MPKSLSVKNIPNLCRKLAHRYMQAFYTDWVYKVFWHFLKMYPICVECLHIGICKHSTQIGYIRMTPIPFLHKLGTFSKMCPICVECLRINFFIVQNEFLCLKTHYNSFKNPQFSIVDPVERFYFFSYLHILHFLLCSCNSVFCGTSTLLRLREFVLKIPPRAKPMSCEKYTTKTKFMKEIKIQKTQ